MESKKRPSVLRLFVVVLLVSGLAALSAGPVHADGVVRVEVAGELSFDGVCSDESVTVRGPLKLQYHEEAHHTVHLTLQATGVGSLGNTYRASAVANQHFAAPSAVEGSTLVFTVPLRIKGISTGGAPNFTIDALANVFVENGKPTGARTIAIVDVTCHG